MQRSKLYSLLRTTRNTEAPKEMNEAEQSEKVEWQSVCCKSHALGELSHEWWEIRQGGHANLMREGLCAECGKVTNFVQQ